MGTIAQQIAEHRAEILERWQERARQLESARGLGETELVGLMPTFLALLGGLDETPEALNEAQRRLVERQVASRLRQGFLLNDILNDFGILGRCILDVTDLGPPDSGTARDAHARLLHELHLTSVAATAIYNEHMLEDEQLEKRYRRLIAEAANEPPRVESASEPVLRQRLRHMLELIMRAVGADTAALLLHDEPSHRLVVSATAGQADEALEQYVSAIDPTTFAGMVASRPQQATFADVRTTELTVSDALAHSGIRSLLGVQLASQGRLSAVVYVGTRLPRTFSASDVRKLEALGDILTPQIDRARLQDDVDRLARRVDELAGGPPPAAETPLLYELGATLAAARANAALLGVGEGAIDAVDVSRALGRDLEHMDRLVASLLDASRASPRQA